MLYGLNLAHKHLPEMQTMGLLDRAPVFSPSVGDFMRGMLVSIPLHTGQLPGRVTGEALHAAYVDHFADEPFITVRPLNDSSALRDGAYLEPEVLERDQSHRNLRVCQRCEASRLCWSRGSTIWAKAQAARPCKT